MAKIIKAKKTVWLAAAVALGAVLLLALAVAVSAHQGDEQAGPGGENSHGRMMQMMMEMAGSHGMGSMGSMGEIMGMMAGEAGMDGSMEDMMARCHNQPGK